MWFQPQVLGVNDPVLLRYQLAYNTEDTFKFDDGTTWLLSSEVLPSTDESGLTTHNLGSITSGVKYSIVILARSSTGDISTPRYVASAVTFGLGVLQYSYSRHTRTHTRTHTHTASAVPFRQGQFFCVACCDPMMVSGAVVGILCSTSDACQDSTSRCSGSAIDLMPVSRCLHG